MAFDLSSRSLLTARDLARFEGETLFCRVARAVCGACCLPRKELFESWAVAQEVRRFFAGGRVVDLACGHGLLAHLLLLLDEGAPGLDPRGLLPGGLPPQPAPAPEAQAPALALDARLPESAARLSAALVADFPSLAGRVQLVQAGVADAVVLRGDLVVSAHACGALTDEVLEKAAGAQARVAVLPCCHDGDVNDKGELTGWMEAPLAIDAVRALALRGRGYEVHSLTIDSSITPKNRLLLGRPLIEAYEAARYEAHLPQGTVVLRHGEPAPALDPLLARNAPHWAFLTAWNPGSRRLPRPENERRQAALRRSLAGYRSFNGLGLADDGSWPAEESVLALGLSPADAIALGRAWGQRAVLLGARGEPARVAPC